MKEYLALADNGIKVPSGSVSLSSDDYQYTRTVVNPSTLTREASLARPIGTVNVKVGNGLFKYGVRWNWVNQKPCPALYTMDSDGNLKAPSVFSSDFLAVA